MDGAGRAKNRRGFNLTVRLPHVFYIQDGEHHSLSITQRNLAVVRLQGVHKALANVESESANSMPKLLHRGQLLSPALFSALSLTHHTTRSKHAERRRRARYGGPSCRVWICEIVKKNHCFLIPTRLVGPTRKSYSISRH